MSQKNVFLIQIKDIILQNKKGENEKSFFVRKKIKLN